VTHGGRHRWRAQARRIAATGKPAGRRPSSHRRSGAFKGVTEQTDRAARIDQRRFENGTHQGSYGRPALPISLRAATSEAHSIRIAWCSQCTFANAAQVRRSSGPQGPSSTQTKNHPGANCNRPRRNSTAGSSSRRANPHGMVWPPWFATCAPLPATLAWCAAAICPSGEALFAPTERDEHQSHLRRARTVVLQSCPINGPT